MVWYSDEKSIVDHSFHSPSLTEQKNAELWTPCLDRRCHYVIFKLELFFSFPVINSAVVICRWIFFSFLLYWPCWLKKMLIYCMSWNCYHYFFTVTSVSRFASYSFSIEVIFFCFFISRLYFVDLFVVVVVVVQSFRYFIDVLLSRIASYSDILLMVTTTSFYSFTFIDDFFNIFF